MTSWKTTLVITGVAAATFFAGRASTSLTAQEPHKKDAAQEMAEWQEAAGKVGMRHKVLDAFTGTWKAEVTAWMDPSAEPMVMPGTMTNDWVMDGKFLRQKFTGDFLGEKFTGLGYWGFNNATKEYESVWLDSTNTAITVSTGKPDVNEHTFTTHGVEVDPRSGQKVRIKSVTTVQDKDHHTFERYYMTDGGPVKGMKIAYTRG